MATGAGICTSVTAPSSTVIFLALAADAAQSAPANIGAFTSAQGAITSCWNPAANAAVTVSPAISATNVIMACYVILILFSLLDLNKLLNKKKK